jgi:hypothetical protein
MMGSDVSTFAPKVSLGVQRIELKAQSSKLKGSSKLKSSWLALA